MDQESSTEILFAISYSQKFMH